MRRRLSWCIQGLDRGTISPGEMGNSFYSTPTIYGWIAVLSASQPCPQCSPIPVLSTIQSVASYPGGVSGTSPTDNVTTIIYLEVIH